MREVVPGVYEWSWFSDEKQITFNGHFVIEGSDRVLIDPPPMTEADRVEIEQRGGLAHVPLCRFAPDGRDHEFPWHVVGHEFPRPKMEGA